MTTLRLESVTLHGVRCFAEPFTAEFAAGLTVVLGPNESGKSTLLAGIGAVLFGVPTRELADWRRDPPPTECSGSVVLDTPNGRYTVQRDFDSHHVRVTDATDAAVFDGDGNPGGRTTDSRKYRRWLHENLGFDDHDTFEDTVFLRLREDEDVLAYGHSVREMVSGTGAQDFSSVEKALVDQYRSLTRANPWGTNRRTDQRIEQAQEQLLGLRGALSEADSATARTRNVNEELTAAQTALADAEQRAATGRETIERLRIIQRVREQRERADADAKRAEETRRRAERLDTDVATLTARFEGEFTDVANVSTEEVDALSEAERLAAAADTVERAVAATPAPGPAPRLIITPALITVAVAFAGGVALGFASGVGGIGVMVLGLTIAAGLYVRARRAYVVECDAYEAAAVHTRTVEAHGAEARERADTALARIPKPLRAFTAESLRSRLHERELLEQKLGMQRDQRAGLPATDVLEAAVRDAAVDLGKHEGRLEELGASDVPRSELARQLHATEQRITQAERDAVAAQRRRDEALRARGEMDAQRFPAVAVLHEEIADLQDHLDALATRRDALHVAVDTLRDAVRDFQRDHVGPIAAEATTLFRAFTREGWDVGLAEVGLEPEVRWEGRGWPVARLSVGTQDQLAVALRLAVVRALRSPVRLPLILDDPLAHWDDARRAAFQEMVGELTQTHQVILATPDPGLAEWGEAVVRLGAPGPGDYTQAAR